jgi:hypothetical protein
MLAIKNVALVTARANRSPSMDHFFCSRFPSETKCGESTIQSYLLPLYLVGDDGHRPQGTLGLHEGKQSNIATDTIERFATGFGIGVEQITPEDIFHYAYAAFHSLGYRSRYAEFLKIDFPRLPLTSNLELFRTLAQLGDELVALHLLESPRLAQPITEFIGGCNPEIKKISWSRDTVWVDKAQTLGFRGVPEAVWNFHIGGYQVCEKWLKDRKGRTLSKDDIAHYQKIVVALAETIRLMKEIDEIIEAHGGWPGAFLAVETADETASPRAAASALPASS